MRARTSSPARAKRARRTRVYSATKGNAGSRRLKSSGRSYLFTNSIRNGTLTTEIESLAIFGLRASAGGLKAFLVLLKALPTKTEQRGLKPAVDYFLRSFPKNKRSKSIALENKMDAVVMVRKVR